MPGREVCSPSSFRIDKPESALAKWGLFLDLAVLDTEEFIDLAERECLVRADNDGTVRYSEEETADGLRAREKTLADFLAVVVIVCRNGGVAGLVVLMFVSEVARGGEESTAGSS